MKRCGRSLKRQWKNREYDSNGRYMYPYGVTWDWMGNGWYQEARTDLPFSEHKKCVKQGDYCYTIGTIALLIGVFFIIVNFTII